MRARAGILKATHDSRAARSTSSRLNPPIARRLPPPDSAMASAEFPAISRDAYRPGTGTGMGGRIDGSDVPIAPGDGFAAVARDRTRCVLSTDSR